MLVDTVGAGTRRFALLGERLGHTWSPVIQNSLFQAAGRDAIYIALPVPPEALEATAQVMRASFDGFNVTIPYKERIIPYLDALDGAARACRAVNTVLCRDGKLLGYSTDGAGMAQALLEGGAKADETRALILGSGGAARAAAYELLRRGGKVTLSARNREAAEAIACDCMEVLPEAVSRIRILSYGEAEGRYDVLVNCTPLGMYPRTEGCPAADEVIDRCDAVFDAVYNPRKTQLLAAAERLGKRTVGGLAMLYWQAVEAQRLWFDGALPEEKIIRSIYRELDERLS